MTLEEQVKECELEIKDLTIRARLAEKENNELKKELIKLREDNVVLKVFADAFSDCKVELEQLKEKYEKENL